MIEIFDISIAHEYEKGKSSQIYLQPFSTLNRLEFNNRLRFKKELGGLRCFCEEDRLLLSENEYLCFWMRYKNTDFIQYSDYDKDELFDSPKFQWIKAEKKGLENTYSLTSEMLSDDTKKDLIKEAEQVPSHTIGMVAISTQLITKKTKFNIQFTTKHTFWQYRIQSELKPQSWEFSIEDKEAEWEFERSIESGEIRLTSKRILPYFKTASNRLLLKWKPLNDPFNYQTYKKVLPFPNFRYKETLDQIEISPVYIKI